MASRCCATRAAMRSSRVGPSRSGLFTSNPTKARSNSRHSRVCSRMMASSDCVPSSVTAAGLVALVSCPMCRLQAEGHDGEAACERRNALDSNATDCVATGESSVGSGLAENVHSELPRDNQGENRIAYSGMLLGGLSIASAECSRRGASSSSGIWRRLRTKCCTCRRRLFGHRPQVSGQAGDGGRCHPCQRQSQRTS